MARIERASGSRINAGYREAVEQAMNLSLVIYGT